jgi:hypothetical protein
MLMLLEKRLIVVTGGLNKGQNRMRSLIRTAISKLIAGFVLAITVVVGGIAGLIGLFVRQQMPETKELEATQPETKMAAEPKTPPQKASVTQSK